MHSKPLALQIRAFLDASEDAEIDQETIDDILDGIETEDVQENNCSDTQSDDGSEVEEIEAEVGELDISALYTTEHDDPPPWSKRDVRKMMNHLKERGMTSWIQEYVVNRNLPIPDLLRAFGINLCKELRAKRFKTLLYFLKVAISRELSLREKLPQYNTIEDAIHLIRTSKSILILTGAGISVSCGIPDFRSRDGIYATLKDSDYQLDDPQQMFDIEYFRENPSVFYSFASSIYPTNFTPSPCHRFIKLIENNGKLLRNYTQNIDTLETVTGVQRVLQCHGSFATASCLECRRRVPGKEIELDILKRKVPLCTVCNVVAPPPLPGQSKNAKRKGRKKGAKVWDSDEEDESDGPDYPPGVMKPDITFFGEKLSDEFDRLLEEDRNKVDLLLVIGTSLKVSPVADILSQLPHSVPQILINKTPIKHINPDIVLLGNADDIVQYLCYKLDWELPPPPPPPISNGTRPHLPRGNLKKRPSSDVIYRRDPQRVSTSHIWMFEGAEGGKWVQDVEKAFASTASSPVPDSSATNSSPGNSVSNDIIDAGRGSKKARFK